VLERPPVTKQEGERFSVPGMATVGGRKVLIAAGGPAPHPAGQPQRLCPP